MKAAQERFAVNYHSAEESSGLGRGEEGETNDVSKDSQVQCALCRDSASASPLCFLIFIQVLFVTSPFHALLVCLGCVFLCYNDKTIAMVFILFFVFKSYYTLLSQRALNLCLE
jgi:hypothetical protein